jgi:Protein of unknown function (DUF3105)
MAGRRKRTTSRPDLVAGPPKPAVAPATPGGPNRQARKDEARRQREALRRKMSRRRAYRVVSLVVAFVVVAGGIAAFIVLRPSAAKAAGCGPVQVIRPYNPSTEDRTHIGSQGSPVATPPPLSSYQSVPPVSGPHDPTPWPSGVVTDPPPIYRTIHSLEHAAVIVWYPPGTTSSALADIQNFYRITANNDHVIVAPYSYPDQGAQGTLPAGKQMVLAAWHHRMLCDKLSLSVVKDFVHDYRVLSGQGASAAYKGDAPELGTPIDA